MTFFDQVQEVRDLTEQANQIVPADPIYDAEIIDGVDLFEDVENPLYGVDLPGKKRGRYHFPPPPGEPDPGGNGWMRMTNLVSAFSDQKALQEWLTWKAFEGLRAHDVIFDEWMAENLAPLSDQERRQLANEYADKARAAARADEGARRGTARHTMAEHYFNTGERTGTSAMRRQMESFLEALDRADLQVLECERYVWHPAASGTMGKLDFRIMCRRTGQIGIGDLKTQGRFWTYQEVSGQLYGYDSAPWQWDGPLDTRGKWVNYELTDPSSRLLGRPGTRLAGKPIAIVAHMPQAPGPGQLPVTLKQIPMAYGARVLACAEQNVLLRAEGRSVKFPVEDFPA